MSGDVPPTILQRIEIHARDEHKFLAGMDALGIVRNEARLELCRTCEGLMKEYGFLKDNVILSEPTPTE